MHNTAIFTALFLAIFFPLAALITLGLSYRKAPKTLQKNASTLGLLTLIFILLDWALLAVLPILGISFGPVFPLVIIYNLAHITLYFGWLISWPGLFKQKHRNDQAAKRKSETILFYISNLIALSCIVYGHYFEPFHLTVSEITKQTSPPQTEHSPIKIVQLTDLHLERTTRREVDILSTVSDLDPDLILLTGDYLNTSYLDDPISHQSTRNFLSQLSAPMGVFAINGTVDNPERMDILFSGLNITVLNDKSYRLNIDDKDIYLIGISDTHIRQRDASDLHQVMQTVPSDATSILLYHNPDLIETAVQTGVDLYLAGHTHGGQVRLPVYGAIITDSAYGKQYEMGQYQVQDTTLYVSRGLGMEGGAAPRVRFLCPPEIVVVSME